MKTKNQITTFQKNIANTLAGLSLDIFGYRIKSNTPGKKVYIQGGIHGGEVTIWIIEKVFNYFENHEFNGEIVIVPISNPIAWQQRSYFYTVGKFDLYMGRDWNRNFPGKEDGTIGERIAGKLTEEASKTDLVIDLHTSRKSFPFGIVGTENDLSLLKIIGLEYNFYMDLNNSEKLSQYKNTLLGQMGMRNIPNVTIECGSHDSYEKEYVEEVFNGLLRLFQSIGLITDNSISISSKKSQYYTKLKTYRAPDAGFVLFKKDIGDSYSKGDVLYEIIRTNNLQQRLQVLAEEAGIIEKQSPTHIYWPGDDVLEVILKEDIQTIKV